MVIFNGWTCFSNGTRNNHFTCFRFYRASVVDYVIVDKDTINSIKQFEVSSKTPDSDHSPLTFAIRINGDRRDNITEREYKPFNKCTWNKENTQAYLISLQAEQNTGFLGRSIVRQNRRKHRLQWNSHKLLYMLRNTRQWRPVGEYLR